MMVSNLRDFFGSVQLYAARERSRKCVFISYIYLMPIYSRRCIVIVISVSLMARQRPRSAKNGWVWVVEGGLKSTSRNRLDACGSMQRGTRIAEIYSTRNKIKRRTASIFASPTTHLRRIYIVHRRRIFIYIYSV